MKIFML